MFVDFLTEFTEKGGGGGGGGRIPLLDNEDEPIFRVYSLPTQPELLVIFTSYFS